MPTALAHAPDRRSSITLLLAMILLGVFPLDVVLPSFPALADHFQRPSADIALSISLFAIGIALSQVVIGPLSDTLGRKRLLLSGMAVSVVGAIGCVLSNDFTWFLVFRCLQAIGCGAFVLVQALVQDLFVGKERDQLRILMLTCSGVFISVSPLAGTLLQHVLGWTGSFWVFAALAGVVFIKALLVLEHTRPQPQVSRTVIQSYHFVCKDPCFIGYWLISGLAFACHFSFIMMSPLLLMERLQLSPFAFAWVLLGYGVAYLCGGITAQLLSNRLQPSTQINVGLLLIVTAGLVMLVLVNLLGLSVFSVLLPMLVCTIGTTIARPISTSQAMDIFPEHAGTAASTGGMVVLGCGGIISALINLWAANLETTLAICFLLLGILSLILHVLINRRQGALLSE